MTRIPFAQWMRLAADRFGITPEKFWRLSLVEWLMLCQPQELSGLDCAALSNLLKTYPDKPHE